MAFHASPKAGDIVCLESFPERPWLLLEPPDTERRKPLWTRVSGAERKLLRAIYGQRLGHAPVYVVPVEIGEANSDSDIVIDEGPLVIRERESVLLPTWAIHGAIIVGRVSPDVLAETLRRPRSPTTANLIYAESMKHRSWLRDFADFIFDLPAKLDAH